MLCVLLSQAKVTLKPLVDILNKVPHSLSLKGSTLLNQAQVLSPKVSCGNSSELLRICLLMKCSDHPPYQPSSPPPNFSAQNPVSSAPFYVAGAEVPSTHATVPQPQPPAPQFGGREQAHVHPQNTVKPPGPINPSSPPQHYSAYGQPPNQTAGGRPPSTYGVQELAASGSGFGSPITGDHPQPPANFSPNPNYSPDDSNPYAGPPSGPSAPPAPFVPSQPSYQTYGTSAQTPPPMPTGQPPQVPSDSMAPPPLQLGGPAYDARQNLPSQHAGQTPQYKPYVPAGGLENSGPSAPAPNDYYHSGAY
jgi:signal transducing adaptor molecule